jgi:hypothetical protein
MPLVHLKIELLRRLKRRNEVAQVKVVMHVQQEVQQLRKVRQENRTQVEVLLQDLKVLEAELPQKEPRKEAEDYKKFWLVS